MVGVQVEVGRVCAELQRDGVGRRLAGIRYDRTGLWIIVVYCQERRVTGERGLGLPAAPEFQRKVSGRRQVTVAPIPRMRSVAKLPVDRCGPLSGRDHAGLREGRIEVGESAYRVHSAVTFALPVALRGDRHGVAFLPGLCARCAPAVNTMAPPPMARYTVATADICSIRGIIAAASV